MVQPDADQFGIVAPDQLYGGVVPVAFVATKVITHPLVHPNAAAPRGWSHAFAGHSEGSVLRGFAAFAGDDARRAAEALLAQGPIRIKRGTGIGGRGQYLASTTDETDSALASIDARELAESGIVVEEHLAAGDDLQRRPCRGRRSGRLLLRHPAGDPESPRARGLRRIDARRCARRFRVPARPGPPRRRARGRGPGTQVRPGRTRVLSRACSLRAATTTWRSARMPPAHVAQACWSSPGALAVRAAPRSLRSKPSIATPRAVRIRCATVEVYDDQVRGAADAFVYFRGVDAGAGPVQVRRRTHDADAG